MIAAICVHGLPSVSMNRLAEHHHRTHGAKHSEQSVPESLSIASIVKTTYWP